MKVRAGFREGRVRILCGANAEFLVFERGKNEREDKFWFLNFQKNKWEE